MPLHFVVWGHLSSLPKVCVPIESRACWIAKVWLLPPLIEMVVAAVVFDLKYLQKRDVPSSLISWMPLPASEKKPSWKIGGAPTGSLAPPAGSMQIASAEAFCFAVVLLLLIACLAKLLLSLFAKVSSSLLSQRRNAFFAGFCRVCGEDVRENERSRRPESCTRQPALLKRFKLFLFK